VIRSPVSTIVRLHEYAACLLPAIQVSSFPDELFARSTQRVGPIIFPSPFDSSSNIYLLRDRTKNSPGHHGRGLARSRTTTQA
jgi:hypothetical protein